jgi:hypothetical protein
VSCSRPGRTGEVQIGQPSGAAMTCTFPPWRRGDAVTSLRLIDVLDGEIDDSEAALRRESHEYRRPIA